MLAPVEERLELVQASLVHYVHKTEVYHGEVHHRSARGNRSVLLPLLVNALAHLPRGHKLISYLDRLLLSFSKGTLGKRTIGQGGSRNWWKISYSPH